MQADAAFWDGIAQRYARQPLSDPEAFERKIAVTRSLMRPEDVVLDIGCGTGSLALRLAGSAATVHGLDVSGEMIRIAREKAQAQAVANVVFHGGAFEQVFHTFGAESLDGICTYSLLHLLPDRSTALQRIHGLLKPGGFFVSSTVCLRESWIPFAPIISVMRWIGKAPLVVNSFDRATIERDIRDAGFVDVTQPDVGAKRMIAFVVARKSPHRSTAIELASRQG